MKHLLTLAALLISTLSLAQFTPYNPDADNDQFVGAQDLLAFLPLFGEDWDLDSLVIYSWSELEPPNWCDEPGNGSACTNYKVVPQDADVIFNDGGIGTLLLPEIPKPLVVFGAQQDAYVDNGMQSWTINGQQTFTFFWRFVAVGYDNHASIILPFNNEWWVVK